MLLYVGYKHIYVNAKFTLNIFLSYNELNHCTKIIYDTLTSNWNQESIRDGKAVAHNFYKYYYNKSGQVISISYFEPDISGLIDRKGLKSDLFLSQWLGYLPQSYTVRNRRYSSDSIMFTYNKFGQLVKKDYVYNKELRKSYFYKSNKLVESRQGECLLNEYELPYYSLRCCSEIIKYHYRKNKLIVSVTTPGLLFKGQKDCDYAVERKVIFYNTLGLKSRIEYSDKVSELFYHY